MTLLDRHIEHDPAIRGGKPRIAGTRITVHDIVIIHVHVGQSLEQIAGKYKLSPAAVHAAMAYYFDNKAGINQDIAADDACFEAFKRETRRASRNGFENSGVGEPIRYQGCPKVTA